VRLTVAARTAAVGALLFQFLAPVTSLAVGTAHLGSIGPGGRLDGPVEYLIGPQGSRTYTFDVSGGGPLLRVSLDLSNRDDCVAFDLTSPSGKRINASRVDWPYACASDGTGQLFDVELTARGPEVGRWTVNVYGYGVVDLAFRLRVALEKASRQPKALLPNLVPWIPWEFGFVAPASDHPGTADDRDNQPGDPTLSCHPAEEPGAVDCLRFSAGVYNIGDGPMFIRFAGTDAYQFVFLRDGTAGYYPDNYAKGNYTAAWAGSGEWHEFHGHRHLSEFVQYELLEVTDSEAGTMTAVGTGDKHGYCTLSQQLRSWDSLAQDHQWASFVNDGEFCRDFMTLERGWGDIYRWQRPGQFVSYESIAESDGTMPAGFYVLRMTVDPNDRIVETNDGDNVGYALIRVIDGGGPGLDTVVVCEQGLGDSPWDPAKTVVPDRFAWAKLAADPGYTPPSCE
jgi:hypothetical protein